MVDDSYVQGSPAQLFTSASTTDGNQFFNIGVVTCEHFKVQLAMLGTVLALFNHKRKV